jgi:hypothetical protein
MRAIHNSSYVEGYLKIRLIYEQKIFTIRNIVHLDQTGLKIKLNSKYHILFTFFILLCPGHIHAGDQVNYDISLAGNRIGQVNIAVKLKPPNQLIAVDGNIDGSPLRLFDSKFAINSDTKSIGGRLVTKFHSIKETNFKSREITYDLDDGILTKIDIQPSQEKTIFSSVDFNHPKFTTPAKALLRLISFPCSETFNIFDGRRIIQIRRNNPSNDLSCEYHYEVLYGPGHVSPFFFKNLDIFVKNFSEEKNIAQELIAEIGFFRLKLNTLSRE